MISLLVFRFKEVHGIVRKLAEELFLNGEKILAATQKKVFAISPLQIHAITRRIKLPEPPCGTKLNRENVISMFI